MNMLHNTNLFAELNMGYNCRKHIDIKLIESVYIGTSLGVRYKINKDKLIYKKKVILFGNVFLLLK